MLFHRTTRFVGILLTVALALALTPVLPHAHAQSGTIAYGDVVSGQITAKNYFELWQFSGTQGDRIRIVMTGDGVLDPYLGLIEVASEQVIAEDDDSAGDTNAMIETTLPSTGEFAIVATRYDFDTGTSQGQYQLELQSSANLNNNNNSVDVVNSNEPVEMEPGVWFYGDLELGASVGGTISADSYAHFYSLELEAGTEFIALMFADGSNLDSYLIFGTEDGTVLAEDDDSGPEVGAGDYDAAIYLTVPETGSYILVATRAGFDQGTSVGNYTLVEGIPDQSDTPVEPDPVNTQTLPPGVEYMGDITAGASVNGAIGPNSFVHMYTFAGNAGDQITITMVGMGELDAYLGVLDPNDEVIAEDDDSGGGATGYDAQISVRLPETGVYVIIATRAGLDQGNTTGNYTLQVTNGAPQAPEGVTGLGGFGGLPGRAFPVEGGETFFLRGSGRSLDPEKQSDLEQFLQTDQQGEKLPGRSYVTPDMTIQLHGNGRTSDPRKATPLEHFLSTF